MTRRIPILSMDWLRITLYTISFGWNRCIL
jgi:hypothetical protein